MLNQIAIAPHVHKDAAVLLPWLGGRPIFNHRNKAALAISNFGIPLTGSMSAGFAVGFMKG